jgi:hypothetical protein
LRFWFYTLRAIWRIERGRWYVWRDAPTDVVRLVAATYRIAKNDDDLKVFELTYQAREEYKLRKRNVRKRY